MTIEEHQKWKRCFLRIATAEVRRRDYLKAAEAYYAAAHHEAVIAAVKEARGER